MMLSATIVLRLGRRLGHGTIISVSGPNRPKYRYFGVAFRKFNEFTVSRKRIIYVLKFIIAIIIKCRDAVDDVGAVGEDAWMDEEDADGNEEGGSHPEDLFAVLAGEVEDGCVGFVVAGGVDVEPAEKDYAQIEQYGCPVVEFLLRSGDMVSRHHLFLGFLMRRVRGSFWQGLTSM